MVNALVLGTSANAMGFESTYPHQTRPSDLIIKVILTFAEKDSILIQDREKDVDKMFKIIISLLAVLMMLSGVILIYDARIITKNFFGFGDQNEASSGLKILGFLLLMIGGLILYFNYR